MTVPLPLPGDGPERIVKERWWTVYSGSDEPMADFPTLAQAFTDCERRLRAGAFSATIYRTEREAK